MRRAATRYASFVFPSAWLSPTTGNASPRYACIDSRCGAALASADRRRRHSFLTCCRRAWVEQDGVDHRPHPLANFAVSHPPGELLNAAPADRFGADVDDGRHGL